MLNDSERAPDTAELDSPDEAPETDDQANDVGGPVEMLTAQVQN